MNDGVEDDFYLADMVCQHLEDAVAVFVAS
jgi:hypothetical protein